MGDRFTRKLSAFAHHGEAEPHLQRKRRRHQEAPAFNSRQYIRVHGFNDRRQPVDRRPPRIGMREQGRDVVEQDPRLGEIRNGANMVAQIDLHGISVRLAGAAERLSLCRLQRQAAAACPI